MDTFIQITRPDFWYYDKVGRIYKVKRFVWQCYEIEYDSMFLIRKQDADVIHILEKNLVKMKVKYFDSHLNPDHFYLIKKKKHDNKKISRPQDKK